MPLFVLRQISRLPPGLGAEPPCLLRLAESWEAFSINQFLIKPYLVWSTKLKNTITEHRVELTIQWYVTNSQYISSKVENHDCFVLGNPSYS